MIVPIEMRPGLLLRVLMCFVLLISFTAIAQTRTGADAVKVMINNANRECRLLGEILRAPDAAALSRITKRSFPKSRIGKMLYCLRLFQLDEEKGRLDLLRSLPDSDIEMEAFNEFTHQTGNSVFQPIYRAYYSAAFRSVVSHPSFLHSMFRISTQFDTKNWPDYDDADWYCSELAKLRDAIPEAYDHAVSQESLKDKKFLKTCGSGH